jgi:hypothetical protein
MDSAGKKHEESKNMEEKKHLFLDGDRFIEPKEHQEVVNVLVANKDIILKELKNLLNNDTDWSVVHGVGVKLEDKNEDILERLNKIKRNPEKEKEIWTLFGLILDTDEIEKNIFQTPKTREILRRIPNLLNAGFSCLTPNTSTRIHNEADKGLHRIHLPLIIPEGDCAIQVQDEIKKWHGCKDVLIFDNRKWHNAWNYTGKPRYVLIVDVLRSRNYEN